MHSSVLGSGAGKVSEPALSGLRPLGVNQGCPDNLHHSHCDLSMPTFETEKIFYFEVGGNITYTDAEGFPYSLLKEAVFGAGITLDPLFYM